MPQPIRRRIVRKIRSPVVLERGTNRLVNTFGKILENEMKKEKPNKKLIRKGIKLIKRRTAQMGKIIAADPKFQAVYTHSYFRENVLTRLGMNLTHSIIILDIDDFKHSVNDKFGHPMGDRVLRAFSEALKEFAEQNQGFAGRHGGEEFELFIPLKPYECAELLRDKFVFILEKKYSMHNVPEQARRLCSAGISTEKKRNAIKEELAFLTRKQKLRIWNKMIKGADDLVYAAKRAGKSQVALHENLSVHLRRAA